jgi:hypothetical protein
MCRFEVPKHLSRLEEFSQVGEAGRERVFEIHCMLIPLSHDKSGAVLLILVMAM